ncbi:hypothetical protein ACWCPF_45415, partial [Streptomyces sp. NPDC001858]
GKLKRGWGWAKSSWGRAKSAWPKVHSAWKNKWHHLDQVRNYASRFSFIGAAVGVGYCAYKQAWGKCGHYAVQGMAYGGTIGTAYGYHKVGWWGAKWGVKRGWSGIKRGWKWWKNR